MDTKNIKIVNASLTGALSAVVFVVILTIVGDLYLPFKNFLKEAHHHHWIGKGIWSTILFIFVGLAYYFLSKEASEEGTMSLLRALSWVIIIGTVILFLFFVYEFIKHS